MSPEHGPVVAREFDLRQHNSFGIAAIAREWHELGSEEQLEIWCERFGDEAPLVLGGGSNILITQARIERPILHVALRGRRILEEDGEQVRVEAMAGEPWHEFVMWTLEQGLSGLENLALIPGSVGAAPVQNIGAYGVEMQSSCESVRVFDLVERSWQEWPAGRCAFAYRDSAFKRGPPNRYLITRVRFRLSRRFKPRLEYGDIRGELARAGIDKPTALEVAHAVMAIRRRKLPDPAELGNAGSFFKNPVVPRAFAAELAERHPDLPLYPVDEGVKLSAAWLIERAGWKGYRRGAAGVHAGHALVLVNHGGATGAELWQLACDIRDDVATRFGVQLEPEPRIL